MRLRILQPRFFKGNLANLGVNDMSKTAIKSMYHFYLTSEILKKVPSTGDIFGLAEDDLVIEIYPYSNLIWRKCTEFCDGEIGDFYSFIADCAAIITDTIEDLDGNQIDKANVKFIELMDIDEFELDVVRVINCHTPSVFCL